MQKQKQNKKPLLNFVVTDEVYRIKYYVYIGDRAGCSALITRKFGLSNPLDKDAAFGETMLIVQGKFMAVIIWLEGYDIYSLVHECFHGATFVLK
jgi:hypothetical protein